MLDDKDTFFNPDADYFDEEDHVKNCSLCQQGVFGGAPKEEEKVMDEELWPIDLGGEG